MFTEPGRKTLLQDTLASRASRATHCYLAFFAWSPFTLTDSGILDAIRLAIDVYFIFDSVSHRPMLSTILILELPFDSTIPMPVETPCEM